MNIKKAAEMFDLSVDTLRYYERVGVIPPVHRNKSGYREYSTNDLNWIYLAKNLRNAGLSVESLIEFANLAQLRGKQDVEESQKQILFDQLEELDQKITEMQEVRELLLYKYQVTVRDLKEAVNNVEDKFLTVDELRTFLNYGIVHEELPMSVLFHVLFYTGCRVSEALALQPEDIDFQRNEILFINRQRLKERVKSFVLKLLRQLVLLDECR